MTTRKPQINFQVDLGMKALYEQSKLYGHGVTRLCAAGFLLMIEDSAIRLRALNRLCEWEDEYADAGPDEIRDFVQAAGGALKAAAPRSRPARKARRARKKAKRSGSA